MIRTKKTTSLIAIVVFILMLVPLFGLTSGISNTAQAQEPSPTQLPGRDYG
jgi:hypothetical protein